MPTINQLVRKPRQTASKKSKSPALGRIHNALKVRYLLIKIIIQNYSNMIFGIILVIILQI